MESQFKCDNAICIDERSKCDGKDDCGDDSDEKGCGTILLSLFYQKTGCLIFILWNNI